MARGRFSLALRLPTGRVAVLPSHARKPSPCPTAPPPDEFRFLLDHVVGFDEVTATERFAEATPDTVSAILTEAAKLCDEVLAPLQRVGDTAGRGAGKRRGAHRAGLRRGLRADCRGRLGRHGGRPGTWRHGPAVHPRRRVQRHDVRRVPVAGAEPAADPGPDRGAGDPCLATRSRRSTCPS